MLTVHLPVVVDSPEEPLQAVGGNQEYRSVRLSNCIVKNMTTFLQLMSERDVDWVIEQPFGSQMFRLPRARARHV